MSEKELFIKDKANKIRLKSLEMTNRAGSGHPTTAMSAAEILSVLYFDQMNYDPDHPDSYEGDDFVISKGHGSPGLYAVMDEAGLLKNEDIMNLRTFQSKLEGHPVPRLPGIRIATGSLGQGLSAGIGLAKAMQLDGINRYVYVLLGDGEMAEGNIWEALNVAAYYKTGNLTGILDVNRLGQSEATMYEHDLDKYDQMIRSFGWHTITVDGHSVEELIGAFEAAKKEAKPSMIIAKTMKGKGVSFLENADGRHGKAVSDEELEQARNELKDTFIDVNYEPQNKDKFDPKPVLKHKAYNIQTNYTKGEKEATRTAFGQALEKIGKQDNDIIALDGDVKGSSRTKFFFKRFPERSIECYIAEQNMIGMAAGLQARGKKPNAATFAAFLTRAHDQIRMASYSQANIKIAGSHAGVSIGQDGPSQMGLEDMAMMRSVFNSIVLSPADAVSAEKLTGLMQAHPETAYMRTIRGKTPIIYDNDESFDIGGSKILLQPENMDIMILATGYTVHEALEAHKILNLKGIMAGVMDIYSVKPLDKQGILDATTDKMPVLTVEDHYQEGGMGEAVAGAIGKERKVSIKGVEILPHSGKPAELLEEQKIDRKGIAEYAEELVKLVTI
jgi:transketolase